MRFGGGFADESGNCIYVSGVEWEVGVDGIFVPSWGWSCVWKGVQVGISHGWEIGGKIWMERFYCVRLSCIRVIVIRVCDDERKYCCDISVFWKFVGDTFVP